MAHNKYSKLLNLSASVGKRTRETQTTGTPYGHISSRRTVSTLLDLRRSASYRQPERCDGRLTWFCRASVSSCLCRCSSVRSCRSWRPCSCRSRSASPASWQLSAPLTAASSCRRSEPPAADTEGRIQSPPGLTPTTAGSTGRHTRSTHLIGK